MADEAHAGAQTEQRRFARVRLAFRVAFRVGGQMRSALALNLSEGGLYVATDTPASAGATVSLELPLRDGPALALTGRVAWALQPDPRGGRSGGMGIEFLNLDEPTRCLIRTLVDRRRAGSPPPGGASGLDGGGEMDAWPGDPGAEGTEPTDEADPGVSRGC